MRTGTHYFPRGVASAGGPNTIDKNRQKFGLNKIDETSSIGANIVDNGMSNGNYYNHRRTESMSCEPVRRTLGVPPPNMDAIMCNSNLCSATPSPGLSPDVQRRLALATYKAMESPSPRQRCRIRTNPWFSSVDPVVLTASLIGCKKVDMETSSTSSGIKSSSDVGMEENPSKQIISSGSESSSSATEIEVSGKKSFTPNTIRRRHMDSSKTADAIAVSQGNSDDENETLNEIMGKFDESYCYEKETDILSDSDPTECISDLDTGQDGGDECDTDDLLDIDFIDTGSVPEIIDVHNENKGSCEYYNIVTSSSSSPKQVRIRRTSKTKSEESASSARRRRKRLTRTRKSSRECRDSSVDDCKSAEMLLNVLVGGTTSSADGRDRGSKSVGGTPVSLRRNKADSKKISSKMTPLANRSNSLTFTEIHSIRNRFLAIADSEKALLKADLEADLKYKQLIHEAETILVSIKTTKNSSSLRETPVPSPRRICSIPTNKRVEMLRNCEADLRRELAKAQKLNAVDGGQCNEAITTTTTTSDNLLINKRIEVLRIETNSAPNSPKCISRFSPRKTHVSNFICANATDLLRRKSSTEQNTITSTAKIEQLPVAATEKHSSSKYSPQLQLNGRRLMVSPPKSPTPMRRRFRSQSPRVSIDSDTDSDTTADKTTKKSIVSMRKVTTPPSRRRTQNIAACTELNGNKENVGRTQANRKLMKSKSDARDRKTTTSDDIVNQNVNRNQLLSFRSVDMGNQMFPDYCPQSEPLKRKIYSGSQTLEKFKKNLEMDSEIPKKALLEKISQLRRERNAKARHHQSEYEPMNYHLGCEPHNLPIALSSSEKSICSVTAAAAAGANEFDKRQLILDTIEDLKRSLEDQSVELCGLNDDDGDDDDEHV